MAIESLRHYVNVRQDDWAKHKSDEVSAVNEFLDSIDESVELSKVRHVIAKSWQAIQANRHCQEEP